MGLFWLVKSLSVGRDLMLVARSGDFSAVLEIVKSTHFQNGKPGDRKLLLAMGLFEAGAEGHNAIVELLLEHGALIDQPHRVSGDTALNISVFTERHETVETLINYGANVNIPNKLGVTPLMLAAEKGSPRLVRLLLENGADASAKTPDGMQASDFGAFKNSKLI